MTQMQSIKNHYFQISVVKRLAETETVESKIVQRVEFIIIIIIILYFENVPFSTLS